MQKGWAFEDKNVPRGTLLWNGNQQKLVCVENYFWIRQVDGGHKDLSYRRFHRKKIFRAHRNAIAVAKP
ncbi:MAG TPA: hypothetical protein VNU72_04435 [Puia sp.]|jgi:hypothetical protein|nr:hypothetical protein [Puia sp.]